MPKETVWEHVKSFFKKKEILENEYYNPLGVRIGRKFTLDIIDHSNLIYELTAIVVHNRKINDSTLPMVDYWLAVGDKKLVLRMLPKGHKDYGYLLLEKYYECEWADDARLELITAANDSTGEFYIDRGTPDEQKFWRVYSGQPIVSTSNKLEDLDGNGMVERDEVKQEMMSYWCFSRETIDSDKITVVEYLWIQLSGEYESPTKVVGGDKMLTILRGVEIDSNRVKSY